MKSRYERQIRFAPWGENGQLELGRAHAAIVGCGALGTVQAEVLARAGVGRLTLIDRDFVELSNLHRQVLFDESNAREGVPKAVAAARRLGEINSEVVVNPVVADLEPGNIRELLQEVQLILDGTDNFETRYLMNDFAVSMGMPWIYGAAVGSYGLTMPVIPQDTPCFRCIYPESPRGAQPTCETSGVLGSLTMLIGAMQAGEALKILSGNADRARRSILTVDVWTGAMRETQLRGRDPDCACCGRRSFPWLEGEHRVPVSLCGRDAVQIHDRRRPVDLLALAGELGRLGEVRVNDFALRFFRDGFELTIFPDGRAIVKGTTDAGVARSIYSRYVGN